MKPSKLILALSLAMLTGASAVANDTIPFPKQIVPVPIKPPVPIIPDEPRKPSRQSVECYYDGENLYLSFAYSEGGCLLTVTDNATLAEDDYAFDSSVPATINIGYVSDASLTITTSLGQTYSGEIE